MNTQHYAVKHPDALLWKGKLTRAEVLARLDEGRVDREWLVCPFGSAERAVPVNRFMDDPDVFLRQYRREAEADAARRAIVASIEEPALLRAGKTLIGAFFLCLVIGGATVQVFFPQMRGAGFTPTTLAILIPIWSVGGIGLLTAALGWVQHRWRIREALRTARQSSPPSPTQS